VERDFFCCIYNSTNVFTFSNHFTYSFKVPSAPTLKLYKNNTSHLLFLVLGIVRYEQGKALVDPALVEELFKLVLYGHVECIKLIVNRFQSKH
jgi:hypothetical protein